MKKLLRSVFVFVLAFSLVLGTGAFTNVGTINVNAAKAQAKITPNSKTIYVGKTIKLKVKKKAKKAKLIWKSSNKRVATVNKKGVVTGRAAGKATIQLKMKVGKKVYRGNYSKTNPCKKHFHKCGRKIYEAGRKIFSQSFCFSIKCNK